MTYLEYKKMLERVVELAERYATGTPEELAKKLNVPQRNIFRIMENIKRLNIPIKYCKKRKTYYIEK